MAMMRNATKMVKYFMALPLWNVTGRWLKLLVSLGAAHLRIELRNWLNKYSLWKLDMKKKKMLVLWNIAQIYSPRAFEPEYLSSQLKQYYHNWFETKRQDIVVGVSFMLNNFNNMNWSSVQFALKYQWRNIKVHFISAKWRYFGSIQHPLRVIYELFWIVKRKWRKWWGWVP